MKTEAVKCVLLADRHHGLTEGICGLLETSFDAVVMVADEASLFESAKRLDPMVAVVDVSLAKNESFDFLKRLRSICPKLKLILLSVHDEPCVCSSALEAGVDGYVLKWAIATDLLPAVDAVLSGKRYISGGIPDQASGNEKNKPS
jgi:DNA-binding NarL/FixJ family response regulator